MAAESYISSRRKELKENLRQLRQDAGYSQEAVAKMLGCARTRITAIEDLGSSSEYSIGEIELLCSVFGKYPSDALRMTGQNAIDLGQFVTERQTSSALLTTIDCTLPKRIEKLFTNSTVCPGDMVFSPSGEIMASIVDSFVAEDWQEDESYRLTLLCWDTRSGVLISQLRLPYVQEIAPLDAERVAILTDRPKRPDQDARYYEGDFFLFVWNVRSGTIERKMQLLDRVGDIAVSPDGRYFAAYMPATTTIQVWQSFDWKPISAFELETSLTDPSAPGGTLQIATEVWQLPRERKWGPWMLDFRASRFDFLNNDVLVVGISKRTIELDIGSSSQGYASSDFEYPMIPFYRLAHQRLASHEIAVTTIDFDYHIGESKVELYYLVPRGHLYPPDSSVHVVKRFPGSVRKPTIVDDACILSCILYDTPYRSGMVYKNRVGLCNVVSGRVVLLNDGGRLRDGDDQISARLSPQGDMVAYWVSPYKGKLRLTIQSIDHSPLRVKGASLPDELEQSRKLRAQEHVDY